MATLSNAPLASLPRHPIPTVNNGQKCRDRLLRLADSCTSEDHLKQIHAQMIRTDLFSEPFPASKLFTALALPPLSSLDYARKVFDEMPQRNLYSWNTLVRAHATSSDPSRALAVFLEMLHECPENPNRFTFPFVIKSATELRASRVGRVVHGMAVKFSLDSDTYVFNSLVHFYASCVDLDSGYRLFTKGCDKDLASWNTMINGFVQGGCPERAFDLFKVMEAEGLKPNGRTMASLLTACAKTMNLEFGKWVCSYIAENDIRLDLTLRSTMLDMYMKCGSVADAETLFHSFDEKERDVVSWTIMLDGYAKSGKCEEARRVFDSMPYRDIAAWNALISAYEQNGRPKEALAVFNELRLGKTAKPDEFTLVSALSSCSQLGAIKPGRWIHAYIEKHNMSLNCHLTTSLIDMYSKCGDLVKALEVFNSAERKDVFVYSSMIAGLGMHGRGSDAINLFYEMQDDDICINPSSVTFTNVLCACSHAGLVEEGKKIFNQMESGFGIVPDAMHYTCVVDMLARAGYLEEAVRFMEKIPIAPTASLYGALLGGCTLHGNLELAELACSRLLELDPRNHGAIVLLSNIHAKREDWDKVSMLRKLMRDSGMVKERGCSSIEVNGVVHEFLVGDSSHPLSVEIYSKLDEIFDKLKSAGYLWSKSEVLQFVEEEEVKEQVLKHHSEKLAIAYGLISTSHCEPIKVVKNLRVCEDCHSVAKLVSSLYGREILLRDRYRFHHFKNGNCSCMDYW